MMVVWVQFPLDEWDNCKHLPKAKENRVVDHSFFGDFDASCTRSQCMLEKGEAALAARDCNCHAAKFAE